VKRCRVIGHVVANAKHPVLDGVGAGIGSLVIVSESGTAGSHVTGWDFPPARSVIVGIIDD
jgi:microcompartment protein CcmK/EutM